MDSIQKNVRQYGPAYFAAALAALLLVASLLTGLWERWERATYDLRYHLRGAYPQARPAQPDIVIVEITDKTLERWQTEPLAFWGPHFASVIENAIQGGASLVALDIIPELSIDAYFAERGIATDTRLDMPLLNAIETADSRLIFSALRRDETEEKAVGPHATYLASGDAQNIGFANLLPDPDGVAREGYLYLTDGSRLVPSFAALLASRKQDSDPTRSESLRQLAGNAKQMEDKATFWINYLHRSDFAGKAFPRIPMEKIADDSLDETEREWLRDAVVIVGPTFAGAKDRYRGMGGAYFQGVEIQAHALSALLHHRALWRGSPGFEALLALFGAAVVGLALLVRPDRAWGVSVVSLLLWSLLCYGAFVRQNRLLPYVGPVGAITLSTMTFYGTRSFIENTLRRRLLPYAPPAAADAPLSEKTLPKPGGELRDISALFFDLRGSTDYAQFRDPNDVMNELNTLYALISPILHRQGGWISSFMGDGFMALFGFPKALPNHAQSAVDASMEILREVAAFNLTRSEPGAKAWKAGCSVHSGPALCGDLGVEDRLAKTAVGETINLASRLEGLNKRLNSILVISRTTYERLYERPYDMILSEEKIDSRPEPVAIYYLPVPTAVAPPKPEAAAQEEENIP